jgi:hypothetical protein
MVSKSAFFGTTMALFLLFSPAFSQTKTEDKAQESTPEIEAPTTQESEDSRDEKDFESFDPSVEISTDNAVSFPTDI